jgi:RND superfamily putative drug exporter
MRWLAEQVLRRPRLCLALVIGAAGLALLGKTTFLSEDLTYKAGDFEVQGSTSREVGETLAATGGLGEIPDVSVLYPSSREPAVRAKLDEAATIGNVGYQSRAGDERVLLGFLDEPGAASAERLARSLEQIPGVYVAGPEIERQHGASRIYRDLLRGELLVLPLILAFALWFFRRLVPALLPLCGGVLTLMLGLGLIQLVNELHPLSLFALNVATGVGLGLSLDYSLLFVSRAREQLDAGAPPREAVATALRTAGRTIAISSGVVTAAFASLLLFPIELLRSSAIAGMVVASTAGVVSVTALPALVLLLWRQVRSAPGAQLDPRDAKGGWYRVATLVMRRPLAVALGAGALMLALAAPASGLRLIGLDFDQLPTSSSTQTFHERAAEFPAWPANDVQVLHPSTPASEQNLKRSIEAIPGVVAVDTYSLAGSTWGANVKTRDGPYEDGTAEIVEALEDSPAPLRVGGATASYLETTAAIEERLPLVLGVLAVGMLLLLLLATRSLLLPPKTFVMNMLSLAAGFGLLVLVFQESHGASLLGSGPQEGLPLVLPVVIVVGAFGLLTDYGLFVLLRIREEWERGLSNREAIAVGLQSSGRVVTAAALMFCAAVGALLSSESAFVKEAAFGLVAVIALDASIVRLLLVPSLMALLGRWNWWLPGWPSRAREANAERPVGE